MIRLSAHEQDVVNSARVAHLATANPLGEPHVIPVCFFYDGECFYSVLDQKPKRSPLTGLKRVRNILANPNVSLVIDHYQEDWGGLWYVLATGTAQLVEEGEVHTRAIAALRHKYSQYQAMEIEGNPVIVITPSNITRWGAIA